MKKHIDRRKPEGIKDHLSLALTTFGVGYIPGAPGTYGSVIGVGIYLAFACMASSLSAGMVDVGFPVEVAAAWIQVAVLLIFLLFILAGIWASDRSIALLGNSDPSQAVVDEVIGVLVTFLFIPFTFSWPLIIAGFLLFRLFDIWKPYPINDLQDLPAGIGICADDILAGIYAGICLAIIYAISLSL